MARHSLNEGNVSLKAGMERPDVILHSIVVPRPWNDDIHHC